MFTSFHQPNAHLVVLVCVYPAKAQEGTWALLAGTLAGHTQESQMTDTQYVGSRKALSQSKGLGLPHAYSFSNELCELTLFWDPFKTAYAVDTTGSQALLCPRVVCLEAGFCESHTEPSRHAPLRWNCLVRDKFIVAT